jgi:asparagine synthase (glutamine-hydrolysing)
LLGPELAEEGIKRLLPLQHIAQRIQALEGISSSHGIVSTLETTLYLRNQLLRDADWASMAHSLELRCSA